MSFIASVDPALGDDLPDDKFGEARERALTHLRTYVKSADTLMDHIDGSHSPVLVTSTDLSEKGPQVLYANMAFLDMVGYELDQILGISARLLEGPETDSEPVETLRRELIQTGFAKAELPRYRRNGERFQSYITVSRMSDEAPGPGVFLFVENEMGRAG